MFSVPFRDGSDPDDFGGKPPLVLATHAVFVESRGHRAPAAVVGLHFQLDSLAKHFLNVTSTVSFQFLLRHSKFCPPLDLEICYSAQPAASVRKLALATNWIAIFWMTTVS